MTQVLAHYASTYGDYDVCTKEVEACGKRYCRDEKYKDDSPNDDWRTKDPAKVTCPKCLAILAKTDFKTVTDVMYDYSSVILYNGKSKQGIQIGEIDLEPLMAEVLKKQGYKVEMRN